MQIVIHGILVFVIGILIGSSLISSNRTTEDIKLIGLADQTLMQYNQTRQQLNSTLIDFQTNFKKLETMVSNNFIFHCPNLTVYDIQQPENMNIKVNFLNEFVDPPNLFVSVNGFDVKYGVFPKDQKQYMNFEVVNQKNTGFELKYTLNNAKIGKEVQLTSISICYVAFLKNKDGFE